jgi:hypothetical protein
MEEKKKFSFNVLFIKLSSRKFWVWIGTSLLFYFLAPKFVSIPSPVALAAVIIVWGLVTIIYLIGEPLETGIGTMTANAKITAELKAGLQATLNTDTAKVIEAIKKQEG